MIDQVLYIDDDPTAQLIFRLANSKASFAKEVRTASNGQMALDYYHQLAVEQGTDVYPHLVFLDLDMPVMGGYEFLDQFVEQYYERFPHTRVMIISSSVNPSDRQKARQYPCVVDFISKPITVEFLTAMIPVLDKP
ncbi:response regulator [Telluribacter humicola]|uniref:response regulator n=1 Tax=Telluribacter humicola TaxID=1720261 RepID=UPI001A96BE85|nr:response regulator [Telluribacter humicola]